MTRPDHLQRLLDHTRPFDILVIGGGATGVGIALDAAARGYSVALLEAHDFGKGTSSRSTKLIHGGVRYLQQGNISLVMEALQERGLLRDNAPHLVHDLGFVVPNYAWWEAPFYGIGMKVYDVLAGRHGFGKSRHLTRDQVLQRIPTLETTGLRGGVLYYDGQFDDARLLINLAQTAAEQGAILLNYAPVTQLLKRDGAIEGVTFTDSETGQSHQLLARCVINATGPFADSLRKLDDPASKPLIAPSQGVHIVLDGSFLGHDTAIMVPRTGDGRVLFAIPWHGHTLIGTTDTPIDSTPLEPDAKQAEIDFLLDTARRYLTRPPGRSDILSLFTGIRPLVRGDAAHTATLARDHTITLSDSGLLTLIGGKWTTYRKMAEDAVDHAITLANLEERPCTTRTLRIHGYDPDAQQHGPLSFYGSDARAIAALDPQPLHPQLNLTAGQVQWATRHEMARSVEDVLARRTRALFLNAQAALQAAPQVAALLAAELNRDAPWQAAQLTAFTSVARHFMLPP